MPIGPQASSRFFMLAAFTLGGIACDSDKGVTTFNTDPTATITSHVDGAEILAGYPIDFNGQVSDPNHQETDLMVTWSTDQRDICAPTAAEEGGYTNCVATLEEGEGLLKLKVVDPQGAAAIHAIEVFVVPTEAPTASILSPTMGDSYYSDQLILFSALIGDAEDDLTDLSYLWESAIDGELAITGEPDSAGKIEGYASLSEGQHAITLLVEDSSGKTKTESVAIAVGGPNSGPLCDIIEPQSGEAYVLGQDIAFSGIATDVDINNSLLTVSWTSDIDGAFNTTAANTAGELGFVYGGLSYGNHTITLSVEDEMGSLCTDTTLLVVGGPPSINLISPVIGDVFSVDESVIFSAEIADGEDTPDDIALSWVSDIDGELSIQSATTMGLAQFVINDLSVGMHTLVLSAIDTDGHSADATVSFLVNTPPAQPSVTIEPLGPTTTDSLNAVVTGDTDADGDPVGLALSWLKNGAATGHVSATVSSGDTAKGETWTVTATPNDGFVDGPSASASIVIQNTPPVLSGTAIMPAAGLTASITLGCSATVVDPDESPTIDYQWTNLSSGVSLGSGAFLDLGTAAVVPNDQVECLATVTDSDGASDTGFAVVTVENEAPVVNSISLSPGVVYTNDAIAVTASIFNVEANQAITTTYSWHVIDADTGVDSQVQTGLSDSLSGIDHFDRGDAVYVVATANDGFDDSLPLTSSTILISNTPPTTPTLTLTPNPAVAGLNDLTCEIDTPAIDDDGDALGYSFTWTDPSGSVVQATGQGTSTLDVYPALSLVEGVWTCEVVVDDGLVSTSASIDTVVEEGCVALGFDGVDDYVESSANVIGDITDLTVAFLIKMDSTMTDVNGYFNAGLVGEWSEQSMAGWLAYIRGTPTGNQLSFIVGGQEIHAPWTPLADKWYRVEIVKSGSQADIYLNGLLIGSGGVDATASTGNPLGLGHVAGNSMEYFQGELSNIVIWKSPLDPGQLQSYWTTGYAGVLPDLEYLLESPESAVLDTSGNGYDASIYGAAWAASCPKEDSDGDGYGAFQDCDDGDAGLYGHSGSAECPAESCNAILLDGNSLGDGAYWIDPDGNGEFEAYCDMTADGGGWTLVARGIGGQHQGWATTSVLNPTLFDDGSVSFKMADSVINAFDKTQYRFTGTDTVIQSWYWSGDCVYDHVGMATGDCNCVYDGVGLTGQSYCGLSLNEHLGLGDWSGYVLDLDNDGSTSVHGYLHTNTASGRNYWYIREQWDFTEGPRCKGNDAGCDVVLFVR